MTYLYYDVSEKSVGVIYLYDKFREGSVGVTYLYVHVREGSVGMTYLYVKVSEGSVGVTYNEHCTDSDKILVNTLFSSVSRFVLSPQYLYIQSGPPKNRD